MLKGLKKSDSRRLKIKKDLLQRFKGRELRFSEKCIKQERMWRLRVTNVISLKSMPTLAQQCMLLLQETVFLLTRKQINTKFSPRHSPLTQESKSSADHYQQRSSSLKSAYKSSSLILIASYPEVKSVTKHS